jgi:hypothetical protein
MSIAKAECHSVMTAPMTQRRRISEIIPGAINTLAPEHVLRQRSLLGCGGSLMSGHIGGG